MAEQIYGTHHIGITVPDIEQGIAFFEAVFGAVTVFRTGPFNVDEAFMQRKLGAAPHTRIRDLVFLRCGEGPSVELFEYSGEDSAARPKRVSEVGGVHLCFEVDDVFASAERLRDKGIELLLISLLLADIRRADGGIVASVRHFFSFALSLLAWRSARTAQASSK